MPNENDQNTGVDPSVAAPVVGDDSATGIADNSVQDNSTRDDSVTRTADNSTQDVNTIKKVVDSIKEADSILVTLSKDPSVDEMAATIGLTLMLDRMGKHATAIYSGKTPNALEFLQPEKTFETNTNSLQDFIIALNKDKADHLRYKIEDDYVKVYITPYRTTIDEKDLQFSHGDINVDLVISLNVKDADDLDAALEKHGRIMHDAVAVNISNDAPGKLGGTQWDEPQASSVSEMIVRLIEGLGEEMTEDVATALLTGVVSATDRFSNDKTTPETMEVSAKLMESGANQQLVAVNIEKTGMKPEPEKAEDSGESATEGTVLNIARDEKDEEAVSPESSAMSEEVVPSESEAVLPEATSSGSEATSPEQQLEQMIGGSTAEAPSIMDELKAAVPEVASVINSPATMPEAAVASAAAPASAEPLFGEQQISPMNSTIDGQVVIPSEQGEEAAAISPVETPNSSVYQTASDMTHMEDGTVEPLQGEATKNYGEMMEKELANSDFGSPAVMAAPAVANTPEVQPVAEPMVGAENAGVPSTEPVAPPENMGVPPVSQMATPENIELPQAPAPQVPGVDGVPAGATSVAATSVDAALPPVQPVPVDESAAAGVPAAPEGIEQEAPKEELNPVIVQPEPIKDAAQPSQDITQSTQDSIQGSTNDFDQNSVQEPVQDPASVPPVADPGAFKIPGM